MSYDINSLRIGWWLHNCHLKKGTSVLISDNELYTYNDNIEFI
jgi:hypothetical protein